MIIDNLKLIVSQNEGVDPFYLRNLLKESLQFYVLNFIYSSVWGENLLLKGGSCLRMFFDLPRLSEDLDLDYLNERSFVLKNFLADLEKYFWETWQFKNFEIKISSRENIVYLKFPLLDQLGLSTGRDKTKILFLRLDWAKAKGKKYQTEISLKATSDFSFLVKRYALEDLFSGKIAALLQRKDKFAERIKGRDYFDLVWFLEKKVQPNLKYLKEITEIENGKQLKKTLIKKVTAVDLQLLSSDLLPLFRDKDFVAKFCAGYQKMALLLVSRHEWGN